MATIADVELTVSPIPGLAVSDVEITVAAAAGFLLADLELTVAAAAGFLLADLELTVAAQPVLTSTFLIQRTQLVTCVVMSPDDLMALQTNPSAPSAGNGPQLPTQLPFTLTS